MATTTQPLALRKPQRIETYRTPEDIKTQVDQVKELMRTSMKKGVHYGRIPGCPKDCLFKPGAELLLNMFRIAVRTHVEDLSTESCARFRVVTEAVSMGSGNFLGSAAGEASSDEERYRWRKVVCQEEWDSTPQSDRRTKWRNGKNGPYSQRQVRVDIADVRNTVLKMAKKRAQIDMTLTFTAASDVFTQDVEDLPQEILDNGPAPTEAAEPMPQRQSATSSSRSASIISEAQERRFYAIYKNAKWDDDKVKELLQSRWGIAHRNEIPRSKYEEICTYFCTPPDAR